MAFLFHRTYLLNLIVMFLFVTIILLLKTLVFTDTKTGPYLFIPSCGSYFCLSSYLLLSMNPIGDTGDPSSSLSFGASSPFKSMARSLSTMSVSWRWKTLSLLPFHLCWGLIHPLWVYFILGSVIGETSLELGGLTLLNSITTLLYALLDRRYLSRPPLTTTAGPRPPLSLSSLLSSLNGGILLSTFASIAIGILLLFVDIHYTRSLNLLWILTLITVLHGLIRSVSENNMIATLADYFPQKEVSSYLLMGTTKTLMTGICFIGFGVTDPRHMNKVLYGIVIVVMGTMALVGYLTAAGVNYLERDAQESGEGEGSRGGGEGDSQCESSSRAMTDLTTGTGVAVLKGTLRTAADPTVQLSQHTLSSLPLPPSLRLHSRDSSATDSVVYVAEYF
jgi:hypothetical protein